MAGYIHANRQRKREKAAAKSKDSVKAKAKAQAKAAKEQAAHGGLSKEELEYSARLEEAWLNFDEGSRQDARTRLSNRSSSVRLVNFLRVFQKVLHAHLPPPPYRSIFPIHLLTSILPLCLSSPIGLAWLATLSCVTSSSACW